MQRRLLLVVLALLATLASAGPATAAKPSSDEGASGSFTLTVHTHSSEFRGAGGAPTLFATQPLSFDFTRGEQFSYSSVSCKDPARFNDVALNFNPDYPGIEDPAAVRHFVEGEVTSVDRSDKTGTIEGTITTYLCRNGKEADQIQFSFEATFKRTSDNQMTFEGTFEITGGTGTFEDMTGEGTITGEFTCLPRILEEAGAESCAELGVFSDFVASLSGTYADPTT